MVRGRVPAALPWEAWQWQAPLHSMRDWGRVSAPRLEGRNEVLRRDDAPVARVEDHMRLGQQLCVCGGGGDVGAARDALHGAHLHAGTARASLRLPAWG